MSSFVLNQRELVALSGQLVLCALNRKVTAGPMLEPLHLQHDQQVSLSADSRCTSLLYVSHVPGVTCPSVSDHSTLSLKGRLSLLSWEDDLESYCVSLGSLEQTFSQEPSDPWTSDNVWESAWTCLSSIDIPASPSQLPTAVLASVALRWPYISHQKHECTEHSVHVAPDLCLTNTAVYCRCAPCSLQAN